MGSLNKKYKKIKQIAKNTKNTKIFFNISNSKIINIMKKSDLAIGAGGVNMIERIYFGLPSMVICTAQNQRNGVNFLKNKDNIYYLGESRKIKPKKILKSLEYIHYR